MRGGWWIFLAVHSFCSFCLLNLVFPSFFSFPLSQSPPPYLEQPWFKWVSHKRHFRSQQISVCAGASILGDPFCSFVACAKKYLYISKKSSVWNLRLNVFGMVFQPDHWILAWQPNFSLEEFCWFLTTVIQAMISKRYIHNNYKHKTARFDPIWECCKAILAWTSGILAWTSGILAWFLFVKIARIVDAQGRHSQKECQRSDTWRSNPTAANKQF